jgi:hypothetical protein
MKLPKKKFTINQNTARRSDAFGTGAIEIKLRINVEGELKCFELSTIISKLSNYYKTTFLGAHFPLNLKKP